MTAKTRNKKGIQRLKPEGEITIYNAASMKASFLDALHKCEEMEIDLSKVNELDSAGFQLLLLAKREANVQDKPLRLINHSEAALEVINLYHMAGHFGDPIILKRKGN